MKPARWEGLLVAAHLLALAAALGPALFFGAVVAPAAFHVLPTRDLAAALVGPIAARLCWTLEAAFAVLLATSFVLTRRWRAPKALTALATRTPLVGIIGAVVIEKLLIPRMDRVREEAPGLIDQLPAADPGRILLARTHRLASGFFGVEIAAAVLLLFVTVRLLAARRAEGPAPGPARREVPKVLDL